MSNASEHRSAQEGNSSPPEHPHAETRTDIRCRSMVFTNFTGKRIVYEDDRMKYLIQGEEICPKTGKMHYQGYVYFLNPRSVKNICKQWGCWVRPAKGTPKQASDYCKKEQKFEEHGTLPRQGRRTDLETLAQKLMQGETTVDNIMIDEPMTYHQYGRTLEKIEDLAMRKKYRTEMTSCDWLVGPTGVGKSHQAFQNFSPDTHYVYRHNDKGWWEGYKQQEYIIINDFRGQIPYDELLQILDKWPYYVPRRGREPMPFVSKKVIITSPLTPEEAYPRRAEKDCISQLLRRVNIINVESRT